MDMADASASIGLVSTTTWLFWRVCTSAAMGFSVQVVHHIITLAAWLAPSMGVQWVQLAMCVELCFQGVIFLVRLQGGKWLGKL